MGTSLTICGAVILSCFSGGVFAMVSFPAVRACFIFVVNFVVLEVLLFATAILTAGGISSEFPRGAQLTFYWLLAILA